jgi:hypothetical protein
MYLTSFPMYVAGQRLVRPRPARAVLSHKRMHLGRPHTPGRIGKRRNAGEALLNPLHLGHRLGHGGRAPGNIVLRDCKSADQLPPRL